ncbi:MAG: J domain-containing protein [Ilumatobacteraceae bacterium]
MGSDPFEVLGLTWQATLDDVRAARRALALELHPDKGGDVVRMQEVNVAFEAAVAHLTGRRPLVAPAPLPPSRRAGGVIRRMPPPQRRGRVTSQRTYLGHRVQHDSPSFTIDALPAEAFEALLVVASWVGEVINDDPPYLLEVRLDEPVPCWCRLDVVPDAGASTVSITVVFDFLEPGIDAETVRDTWVASLNQLGRQS